MFVVLSVFYWGRGDVDDEDVFMFVVLSVFYWGRGGRVMSMTKM